MKEGRQAQSKSSSFSVSVFSTLIPIIMGKYSPKPNPGGIQGNLSRLCNVMSSCDVDIMVTLTPSFTITILTQSVHSPIRSHSGSKISCETFFRFS